MRKLNHYETLGVPPNATRAQIRAAYRKLVLKLHPDRSGNRTTTEAFMRVNEAYKVLSDEKRRREFDSVLRLEQEIEAARRIHDAQPGPNVQSDGYRAPHANVSNLLLQAAKEFSLGRMDRAESLARQVVQLDRRQAVAHALLGDIARYRERLETALSYYAYAVQYDPLSEVYLRRYEELSRIVAAKPPARPAKPAHSGAVAGLVTFVLSTLMLGYVGIAREAPMFENLPLVGTWSVGLFVMMFVNGVLLGASLSVSQTVDRWETVMRASSGKLGPAAALGLVAIVNFWASALIYVFLGLIQNSFTFSISRLVSLVALLTLAYTVMSNVSPAIIPLQTLLWGGNVIYLGSLCGWVIADALR